MAHRSSPASQGLNPHVSVDCVIFGFDFDTLNILLIEQDVNLPSRNNIPKRRFALPGNLVRDNETLEDSARRVLKELTNLDRIYLEQFHSFGDPNRVLNKDDQQWLKNVRTMPDARVITVAYYSLVKLEDYQPSPSSFARSAVWWPVQDVPLLAFDHNSILEKALWTLRNKIVTRPIGFELLPEKFTLGQLQKVYETVLSVKLDKRNFRRKIANMGILIPLDEKQTGVPHKPARLYKFCADKYKEMLTTDLVFQV